MQEDIDFIIETAQESMSASIEHLNHELSKIRSGKASPTLLQDIKVESYGTQVPISQIANIKVADGRTLTIEPWEKSNLGVIEKAIFAENMGLTPQNDGMIIRINLPPMTEDRRIDLAKQAHGMGEKAKVSLRSVRRDAMDEIKKEVKNGFPEDAGKRAEAQVEDLIKSFYVTAEKYVASKEKEIMTV
jgi:ribosome recycling factor